MIGRYTVTEATGRYAVTTEDRRIVSEDGGFVIVTDAPALPTTTLYTLVYTTEPEEVIELDDGATVIDASLGSKFITANTAPTSIVTISNFTGELQQIELELGDDVTTIVEGADPGSLVTDNISEWIGTLPYTGVTGAKITFLFFSWWSTEGEWAFFEPGV